MGAGQTERSAKGRSKSVEIAAHKFEGIVELRSAGFRCQFLPKLSSDQSIDEHMMVFKFFRETTNKQLVRLINGSTLDDLTRWLGRNNAIKVDGQTPFRNISELKTLMGRSFQKVKKQLLDVLPSETETETCV